MDQLRRVWFFGQVSLLLLGIEARRVLVHRQHWEVLNPNPLFSALVASEKFLLGLFPPRSVKRCLSVLRLLPLLNK
jgi:hypothetical protein